MSEHHRVEADLFAIQFYGLILDNALIAQPLDASPASRLRQADLLTNRRRIDARHLLQNLKNSTIYLINGYLLHTESVLFVDDALIMHESVT